MAKDILQGKPLRHPLHPLLAHFPIGLFVLSFLLDAASFLVPPGEKLVPAAFYSMIAGIVMALAASVPGLVDYLDIRSDHPAKKVATTHMTLNLIVVALYGSNVGLRYDALDAETVPWVPFLLSLAGVALLGVSGYLGGRLIYDDGISVGRHRRQTPTPQKTICIGPAVTGETKARDERVFVPVANAEALADGTTLRVSVHGHVLTVAKFEGELFAFQEFCTHRYGPLSEGCLQDGQIECPWHRSRFDMRSGKVTEGPAKVDLKTYPVEIRDGKIQVAV